jgi:hypothetical protein
MSGTLSSSTPTNRRLAGITAFSVNGSAFHVTEFSWSPGSVKRESMTSLSGVDGYSETPKAPYIAGKFRDGANVNVTAFNAQTNATVVVQLANGKRLQGHGLWNTGENEVAGVDATFDFKFEGVQGSILETGGPV